MYYVGMTVKEKNSARRRARYAVRIGRLKSLTYCGLCKCYEKIEGHHPDYTRPYFIVWLCKKCHTQIHNSFKDAESREERCLATMVK